MGGGVQVEDVPYDYTYRGYPFGARRIPVYNSSYPEFWNDGRGIYDDESVYSARGVPVFGSFNGDADSFVRKRKLDGLKGEEISSRGRNIIGNLPVENGSKARGGVLPSKPKHPTSVNSYDRATTPAHDTQTSHANATNSRHPSAANVVRDAAQPRVISIPVFSSDEGRGHSVKCTVIPQEGTKKLKKAVSDEEAAVLVQSWFRGYQVRKTAPLTQLRHVTNVKSKLKDFEEKVSDAEFVNFARENSVAKLKLTEGLMNLLLELDSIQGAHPSVRAVRKVVTKEVITLQGKVDSLLSAEMAETELSNTPMEVEGENRDELDVEQDLEGESRLSDSVAEMTTDAEEPTCTECAEPDPDQDKGEVSTVEGSPDETKYESREVDDVELHSSTQMDSNAVEETALISGDNSCEPKEMVVSDPKSDDENGREVDDERTPQAAQVTTVETEDVGISSNAEGVTPLAHTSESFPQESDKEGGEPLDLQSNENRLRSAGDLDKRSEGLNSKLDYSKVAPLPHSPKSPFEAADWLTNSDSEPEVHESPEIVQGVAAETEADNEALLLKLSEENKVLKSLLVTVMKWNQMQATTMQDVKHRLGKLESKVANKKSSSRRKGGKSRRMILS